jgi:hypothetical protein
MNHNSDRRFFLKGAAAAGFLGAAAFAQSNSNSDERERLRKEMLAGIEDDVKKDLEMRAKATEELPKPKNLRDGAMLDARFPVYYRTSVPEAMRLVTGYFAAYNDRDMAAVSRTLHFPYATYEGTEPLVYRSADEFLRNPPPSITESALPDSQLRPGTYDILDNLQLQTLTPSMSAWSCPAPAIAQTVTASASTRAFMR